MWRIQILPPPKITFNYILLVSMLILTTLKDKRLKKRCNALKRHTQTVYNYRIPTYQQIKRKIDKNKKYVDNSKKMDYTVNIHKLLTFYQQLVNIMKKKPDSLPFEEITKEQFELVIEHISTSHKSLKNICKDLGLNFNALWKKIHSSKIADKQYTRAKSQQAELTVEEMLDTINKCDKLINDPDTDNKTKNAIVNLTKVKCDNIKWIACKLLPKVYGDRITNELTTDPGGLKITFSVSKKKLSNNPSEPTICSGDTKEAENDNV